MPTENLVPDIPGLNRHQMAHLREKYATLTDIQKATDADLLALDGIGDAALDHIKAFAHSHTAQDVETQGRQTGDLPVEVPSADEEPEDDDPHDETIKATMTGEGGTEPESAEPTVRDPAADVTPTDAAEADAVQAQVGATRTPAEQANLETAAADGNNVQVDTTTGGGGAYANVNPRQGQIIDPSNNAVIPVSEPEGTFVEGEPDAPDAELLEDAARDGWNALQDAREGVNQPSQGGWTETSEPEREAMRIVARALHLEPQTTDAELHGTYVSRMTATGWKQGEDNPARKTSPTLVPWDELPEDDRKVKEAMGKAVRKSLGIKQPDPQAAKEGDRWFRAGISGLKPREVTNLRDAIRARDWLYKEEEGGRAFHVLVPAGQEPLAKMEPIGAASGS